LSFGLLVSWSLGPLFAARASFDIPPPLKRQSAIQLAQRLAARTPPPPVSPDLPSPFNPPDFEKREPAEAPAGPANVAHPGGATSPGGANAASAQPPPPLGDRAILEAVAEKIPATGMILFGSKPILTVAGGRRFEIGSTFTVSYDNQDYDLEVVAIDRTTFTLRYRGEEVTRSIRLVK